MNKVVYKVRVMDPMGLFSANKALPQDSICRLTINDEPLLNGALIETIEQTGMRSLQRGTSSLFVVGADSELEFSCVNGWGIAALYECDPPPIGDLQHVGFHLRAIFRTAGFKDWQLAGISPTAGIIIRGPALGADWTCRCDGQTSCADAARAIMESYGFGCRLYMDRFGVWQFVELDLSIQGTFTSSGVGFTNLTEPGRLAILSEIDLMHDRTNYFNDFVVIGGKNSELRHHMPGSRALLKRKRTKTITNTGLRTKSDLIYACRSLEWLYGRGGRRGTYTTFFHTRFDPGHRILCDETRNSDGQIISGIWEIQGISGGSWARDESRWGVIEV